jgi:hypothetical protein
MLQSYFDSVARSGTTRGIEEEKEMVADKLTEVFKLVKFMRNCVLEGIFASTSCRRWKYRLPSRWCIGNK